MKIAEIAQPQTQQPVQRKRMLVVVHPGSACGSADFNLGKYDGPVARDFLARDITGWNGSILVVDSELSDELPQNEHLNAAIASALARAKAGNQIAGRVHGDPMAQPRWVQQVTNFVKNLNPAEWLMELTGAWADHDGCVAHVYNTLVRRGFRCDIRDSALYLDR